jgi:low affinity Fe/Cu permease
MTTYLIVQVLNLPVEFVYCWLCSLFLYHENWFFFLNISIEIILFVCYFLIVLVRLVELKVINLCDLKLKNLLVFIEK